MRYRPLTDIFPVGYPFLPSEVEVRRKCRQWLDIAHDDYNLLIITGQINQIVDPYLKEYTTVVMHDLIIQEAANPDSDYRLNSTCLEALENDFRRIISNAWSEQVKENINTAFRWEEGKRDQQDTRDVQALETTSEVNMQLILAELRRAHERIDKMEEKAVTSAPSSQLSSNWTLIDLWLIDKKEVPAHYQEDYDNFHSIMNRYLRNKTQLEDILAYLRRYDGKFLNLPRHSKGKSKGRLDQTAIREAMDAAGFSFKKSNYSKVLSGH